MFQRNHIAWMAVAGAFALPGAALGQEATVSADLNLRAGPGPTFEVLTVIPQDEPVMVAGCTDPVSWCQVTFGDTTGWAYADYITYAVEDAAADAPARIVIREAPPEIEVPVVTYEAPDAVETRTTTTETTSADADGTVGGAVGGAIVGAIVGGPVGAAIGGVAGGTLGTVVDPPEEVRAVIVEQEVEPVYLEGEVVLGARLPEVVELQPVPDYEYRMAYINQQRVLVDPETREIVYILR